MFRQTDNRKTWYEWMVEVFALLDNRPPSGSTGSQSLQQAAAATTSQVSVDSSSGRASPGTGKSGKQQHPTTAAAAGAAGGGVRRFRVAMSEMHSSIKDGCLM